MKKMFFLLFALAGVLHAEWDENCCAQECRYDTGCGTFVIGGDWLYWKVEERRLQYGAKIHLDRFPDSSPSLIDAKILKPKTKWNNGFRAFGAYITPCNTWKVTLAYTYIPTKTHHSDSVNLSDTDFLQFLQGNYLFIRAFSSNNSGTGTNFANIESDWKSHLSYLDLDIAKSFTFFNCFQLKPHLGLRGLWMHQKVIFEAMSPTNTLSVSAKDRLYGFGVEGGLWGALNLSCGFAFVGHIGGSIEYVKNRNPQNGKILNITNGELSTFKFHGDDNCFSVPSVDSFLGIVYVDNICDFLVSAHIGWEQHIFIGVNQFDIQNEGNINMQGLTLGAAVGF